MRILFLLLFPVFLSAQINNAYGVIEIGSFPTSSSTGPKFAYRPADSSFYRWVSGSTWLKVIPDGSSGGSDTLYLKQLSGTTALVNGDTIDISTYFLESDTTSAFTSYLKRPVGWGLSLLAGKYPFVDSSKVASRYYVSTSPTTIAVNYAAVSNGTNLIAQNLFDNNTYAGVISRPWKFGEYTTAGLPTGVTGYMVYNTTTNGLAWYQGSRWAYGLESTFNRGTATRVPFFDANGQMTESGNLTYTGTRLQTGGSFRIGRANVSNDTISMEKFEDGNSRIFRVNNPGSTGGWASGFVFRGGFNGVISSTNTFRIYTNSSTLPGSVYIGNVTEAGANAANPTTNFGVLNKISSTNAYDTGVNLNPSGLSPNNFSEYALTNSKHFGIFIGGQGGTNSLRSMSDIGYGVFAGFQYQPVVNGYGSSWVFVNKNEAGSATELLRLQGKDGNICLGCTNAQYKLYTTSTDAYGLPRGTVAQRPTIITATTPLRFNTDSTALEYGESVGTWRQIASRTYARSLVNAISTANIGNTNLTLTGNRILHGAGYSLAFNANTTVRDSFVIGNLPEFDSEYITISDNSTGLQGKKKWIMQSADSYNGISSGFFFDNGAIGKQVSGSNYYYIDYSDTTGYHEQGFSGSIGGYNKVSINGGAGSKYRNTRISNGSQIIAFDMDLESLVLNTDNLSEIFKADTFGVIKFSYYGIGTKEASDLSKTQSNYIAGFATDGTVLDFRLTRDTFIEDVTLFAVGTLMNDCQELTIVSSMTATAPSHQEIRFPDAGDYLRGKKIIVYQKKKEAGIYVPQIKVVGGVSRLYFTTNTLTTDPSDQSVLSMDDVTWYTHGVTYEFTCLRIDNTPSYRWVLKQR